LEGFSSSSVCVWRWLHLHIGLAATTKIACVLTVVWTIRWWCSCWGLIVRLRLLVVVAGIVLSLAMAEGRSACPAGAVHWLSAGLAAFASGHAARSIVSSLHIAKTVRGQLTCRGRRLGMPQRE